MARFGVRLENDPTLSPQDYQELSAQAENNGFEAVWVPEGGGRDFGVVVEQDLGYIAAIGNLGDSAAAAIQRLVNGQIVRPQILGPEQGEDRQVARRGWLPDGQIRQSLFNDVHVALLPGAGGAGPL